MDLTRTFKKQTLIILISVIGISIVLLGTSYALFFRTNQSTREQVVSTGTLVVDIPSPQSSLTADLQPKFDSEIGNNDTYTFTVRNTGTLPISYEIILSSDTDENLSNSLDHKYIKVAFDGGTPQLLSQLPRTSDTESASNQNDVKYVLLPNETLAANNGTAPTATHYIQLWLVPDTPVEYTNKTVNLEISVNGILYEEPTVGS